MSVEIVTGADAQANVVGLPACVMIYGPAGIGKSTDAVSAFTKNGACTAFAIPCEDGALKSIAARGLPVPDHPKHTVKSWEHMVEVIGWLAQNRGRYNAVIIDGISPFTSYVYKAEEDRLKGNKNKFMVPVAVRGYLFQLREWIRMIGMHAVFVAHASPPAVLDGVFYPGCPAFSPKSLTHEYVGQLDTVLRVDYLTIAGRPPFRVYYTGGEVWPESLGLLSQPPDWRAWRVKNREGVNQAVVPADLGAFLRTRNPPYAGL